MATSPRLTIAHVTPYTWGHADEVNEFAGRSAAELSERGHRVVIAAPVTTRKAVRESLRGIDRARDDVRSLFGPGWKGERIDGDGPPIVGIGQGIPMPRGPKPRAAPFPLDVSGTLEQLLASVPFDIVHVHDPFAPSAASAALRHSRALNVGSFHEPTERILSTQVARPLVEIFLGRLDARTVSGAATRDLMNRFFPGSYERVASGADAVEAEWPREGADATAPAGDRPLRIAYCGGEERGALRLALRALRRLPLDGSWEAVVCLDETIPTPRINRELARRVSFARPSQASPHGVLAAADVVCLASGGPRPAAGLIQQAFVSGTVPVVAQIPP